MPNKKEDKFSPTHRVTIGGLVLERKVMKLGAEIQIVEFTSNTYEIRVSEGVSFLEEKEFIDGVIKKEWLKAISD